VQWSFGFEQSVRRAVTGADNNLEVLRAAIVRRYLNNDKEDAFRRVVFPESFDSVRRDGRISTQLHGMPHGRKRSFLATALAFVTPAIPMLLQGQELWDDDVTDRWSADDAHGIRKRLRDLIALRHNAAGHTLGLRGH